MGALPRRMLGASALFALLLTQGVAIAAEDPTVNGGGSAFTVGAVDEVAASIDEPGSASTASSTAGHYEEEPACLQGGDQTCGEVAVCDNGTTQMNVLFVPEGGEPYVVGTNCPVESAQSMTSPPVITPGLVAAAFRRIPLPASDLMVQPPNGRTLVNLETNFFTEQGEFSRSVRLLGRSVELAIWPERFVWRFGDGAVLESESPGSAYPDLEITHAYRQRGQVSPSVDTTYAARFRVDGGAWREVPGTVTVPGAAESLRVVTARPLLVGG